MITIVSGLPRSGTSLMMQVLEKSGMEILTDNVREADESNKCGYYEFEKVKKMMNDVSWVPQAEGKAVKVIVQLLDYLPDGFEYKVIFMERDYDEIVNSQSKMLDRLGPKKIKTDKAQLKKTFQKQVGDIKNRLQQKDNFLLINVSYGNLIFHPESEIEKMEAFFTTKFDRKTICSAIDPDLYRERKGVRDE
ncbi:MAG: hypothetical protein JEZ12_09375 [Desulfobacterium sp.]|nr:hypothetical protein [Desulfobacterium sp.]